MLHPARKGRSEQLLFLAVFINSDRKVFKSSIKVIFKKCFLGQFIDDTDLADANTSRLPGVFPHLTTDKWNLNLTKTVWWTVREKCNIPNGMDRVSRAALRIRFIET